MIRSFIAFDLENEEIARNISIFLQKILKHQPKLKIVKVENIHLTIKFLGNINESVAPKIYNILENKINKRYFSDEPLIFKLKKVGNFRKYSIIWISIDGYIDIIQEIKDIIEDELFQKLNIKKDERMDFNPHLTIARLNKKKIDYNTFNLFKNEIKNHKDKEFGKFYLQKIKLKKSILTPKGPIYSDMVF
ncbi:MAG: RNA 2',3'-cyclic phosphodiesterase [Candidatus Lokiarchaeota archaeon]|nr:RNA 2',3'-cyclic phosphodiesterase [Candidatus Lokiarchaeota archaeon]